MAKEELTLISESLLRKGKPFLDELKTRGMAEVRMIEESLHLIATDPQTACWNLYLLLQSESFNEIQEEDGEAGKSLMFLYNLMANVLTSSLSMQLIEEAEKAQK